MTEGSGATRDERGVVTYTVNEPATRNALSTRVLQDIDDPCARSLATRRYG
jgi:hypothetical protein